jgi:hypothetical protein
VAYRFYAYHCNGQHNPDGSPCQGILYRSLDLRSYADQNWLQIQQFKPGCACLTGFHPIPINFFEPDPFLESIAVETTGKRLCSVLPKSYSR